MPPPTGSLGLFTLVWGGFQGLSCSAHCDLEVVAGVSSTLLISRTCWNLCHVGQPSRLSLSNELHCSKSAAAFLATASSKSLGRPRKYPQHSPIKPLHGPISALKKPFTGNLGGAMRKPLDLKGGLADAFDLFQDAPGGAGRLQPACASGGGEATHRYLYICIYTYI